MEYANGGEVSCAAWPTSGSGEGGREDLSEVGMCVTGGGGSLLSVIKCSPPPPKQVVQDHFEGGGQTGGG